MTRVAVLFLITAAAFGLVAFAAWNPELWEPWLDARGITREDSLFLRGLKLAIVILVGVPLTALIYAIGRLGSDRSQRDIHGYTVLRLKAGTRWFCSIALIGLAALFFAYPLVDPMAPMPWAYQAVTILCLLGIPVILRAKVRYDDSTLSVSNSFGGQSLHHWADLTGVREVKEMKHILFTFRNDKKAKISHSYAGLGELLETAQLKLAANAGPRRVQMHRVGT